MKKISYYFLFLLVLSAYADKKKLPVISKAKQLKTVKGKQIIWKKDGSKMVRIPYTHPDDEKKYVTRLRHSCPIPTKSLKLVSGTDRVRVIKRVSTTSWYPFSYPI